jgi:fatty acid desaturase
MTDKNASSMHSTLARFREWFRYHAFVFAGGIALLFVANLAIGGGWWSFWPMFSWSLVFAFHFFLVRAMRADDAWADDRAMRLRSKSYDIDHIQKIEESFKSGAMPGRHDLNLPAEEADTGELGKR